MEKKNQYGVQIGDIFQQHCSYEDWSTYDFYQVVALRGTTQVTVRRIGSKRIALDGSYEAVVPVPDAWGSETTLVRKVYQYSTIPTPSISIEKGWWNSSAYLYDPKDLCLIHSSGPSMAYWFRKYHPELAELLHLKDGSGVYAVDRPFTTMDSDCPAVIRYPDGREEKTILRELLHYEDQMRTYQKLNSIEQEQPLNSGE